MGRDKAVSWQRLSGCPSTDTLSLVLKPGRTPFHRVCPCPLGPSVSKPCVTCLYSHREPWHAWELTGSFTPFFQLDFYSQGEALGKHNQFVVIWCNIPDTNKWLHPWFLLLHLPWDKKVNPLENEWKVTLFHDGVWTCSASLFQLLCGNLVMAASYRNPEWARDLSRTSNGMMLRSQLSGENSSVTCGQNVWKLLDATCGSSSAQRTSVTLRKTIQLASLSFTTHTVMMKQPRPMS